MAESGLDPKTWLAIIGVFVLFFGLPLGALEIDRRKKTRAQSGRQGPGKAPDRIGAAVTDE